MSELPLDDQLKKAQIDKTLAEAKKLEQEAQTVSRQASSNFWSEAIKVLGGVLLGVGGVVAAYTQYEVGELKAKNAKDDLERSVAAKADAEKARHAAESAASEAFAKRDQAVKEQHEAEQAVAELKASLAQTNSDLKAAKPSGTTGRLAYIQFRGDLTRDVINQLREALKAKAFNAPGAERVAGDYQNLVKYFRSDESADAEALAAAVESFFAAKGCPLKTKMRVVPASGAKLPDPPLEVWLMHECKG